MNLPSVWILALAGLLAGCASHQKTEPQIAEEPFPYDRPLVSPGAAFARLPPVVQNTIRAETGGAEITEIVHFTNANQVIYKVWFVKNEIYPPLYVGADGSVLGPDLTVAMGAPADTYTIVSGTESSTLKLSDLMPPPVLKAVQQRAALTDVARLSKQTWGDRAVYIISFKDPARHPTLYISADGTILNESTP